MRVSAVIFVFLLASICALPQNEAELGGGQERIVVERRIRRAVEEMNQNIVESGGDPLQIPYSSSGIDTPLGWTYAHVEGLECTGASHNTFDTLSYSTTLMRLTLDFVWPKISCVTKSTGAKVNVLGREFSVSQSGSLEIAELRVKGVMRFALRLGGVVLTSCDLTPTVTLKSDLKAEVQGRDVSHKYNGAVAALDKQLRDNKDAIGDWMCKMLENAM